MMASKKSAFDFSSSDTSDPEGDQEAPPKPPPKRTKKEDQPTSILRPSLASSSSSSESESDQNEPIDAYPQTTHETAYIYSPDYVKICSGMPIDKGRVSMNHTIN